MHTEPAAPDISCARGRVLFLCDRPIPDPAVAAVAAELGYEVVNAADTDAAVRLAGIGDYALALAGYSGNLDATLDGIRRLRAALPRTPLLAHGIPREAPFPLEWLYEAGALGVLHDPVTPAILRANARFYLDAYATDMERRRAEAALVETQARLESIISAAEVAVWTWDVGADRVVADERMAELFGLAPGRAAGAPVSAYLAAIHPDDLSPTEGLLQGALDAGSAYEATFRVCGRDGTWRWVLARGQVERARPGVPAARLRGVVIDGTLRKQAEERMQASEERYRTLFDAIDDSVCVVEVVPGPEGCVDDVRFIEVNAAFVRHTGLSEAAGQSLAALLPDDTAHWFALCGRACASGEPIHFVNDAPLHDRWFDIYLARVGPAGSLRVVVLFTDITERRRTEFELRRLAADLAAQDKLKTEFLATLAHELRNPLAPIRSGLQLMRRTRDPAAVARVQDIMDRQVDHLVRLVDDLLDVARITRGQIELKPDWIELGAVVVAAVESSMPLIEASRHRLEVRAEPGPLRLYADPTRITQVISNLLNNAAKYTPRGGAIVLTAARDADDAVITVADDGIGIPPESLEEVFTMFTQVAHGTQRTAGGLGIGLSLVRRLVMLHGGSVRAESGGPEAGSVFTVRLPLAGPGMPHRAPPGLLDAAGPPGGTAVPPLRVLVVDDNRDAAEMLAALLGMLGHTCAIANDGYQALRMLPDVQPQVVFLDIGMPGMSGHEVAQAVRADPAHAGLRLVALTGWGGDADRARSAAAGFDAHLTKPAALAAIEEALAALALPANR
jgi:PAS domain S-box-containing protein